MSDAILTVAAIQMEPRIGEKERNVAHGLGLMEQAVRRGAKLLVLPELADSGYVFESREEAFALSEEIPGGLAVTAWSEFARRHGVHVVSGLCERGPGGALYNSAVLIGPDGPLGSFRKVHLWDQENRFFTPGDLGFPVFDLRFGRLAMLICYDGWFPESFRACALSGADLVCIPTNWVPMPDQPRDREMMANTLVMAAAHSNGVFVVAADRVGVERGQPFLGSSLIVGPTGFPVAGPASETEEEILVATIDLARARQCRTLNTFNHLLQNRRPDQYGSSAREHRG